MSFLVILVVLVFISSFFKFEPHESEYTGKRPAPFCPPHKWIYGSDGFLVCEICRQKPGYQGRT